MINNGSCIFRLKEHFFWKKLPIYGAVILFSGSAYAKEVKLPRSQEGVTSGGLPLINYEAFGKLSFAHLPEENGVKIVGRVNGTGIPLEVFQTEMKWSLGPAGANSSKETEGTKAALKIPVMDAVVRNEVFYQFARKASLLPTEAEIKKEIERRNGSLPPGNKLEDRASHCGLPTKAVYDMVRTELIVEKVEKFLGDQAARRPVDEKDYNEFVKNASAATSPTETFRASHIVIRATPDMSEFAIEDNRAKAEDILKKIREGEDFGVAAQKYSQDRFTAYLKGDLGYFTAESMYEEFASALKDLQVGEISGIIKTPVGFHVIKLTEKHPTNAPLVYQEYRKNQEAAKSTTNLLKNAKIERFL